jgi:hypothetical protein
MFVESRFHGGGVAAKQFDQAATSNRFGAGKAGGQTVRNWRGTASIRAGTGLGRRFRVPVIMEKSVLGGKNISFIKLISLKEKNYV